MLVFTVNFTDTRVSLNWGLERELSLVFTNDVTIYEVQQGDSTIDVSEYCEALSEMNVHREVEDDTAEYEACGNWEADKMEEDNNKASTAATISIYITII